MKKIIVFIFACIINFCAQGQLKNNDMTGLVKSLANGIHGKKFSGEEIKKIVNGIITDPELYNDFWKNFLDLAFVKDSKKFNFLRDLNIKFKTFQAEDTSVTGLGFSYDFKFDFAKYTENKSRISQDLGFTANGNVAFKKKLNPNDFLESKFHYTLSFFKGGVIENTDTAVFILLNDLEDKLASLKDMQSPEAMALREEFGRHLVLTDQYYYSLAPKFALESNQDFTKKQFTPGIIIGFGAKGWNTKSTLSKLNVLDYPFALLRLLTGTDRKFTPYGSTLPAIQLALDYVIPTGDAVRKQLVNNSDPFPRFKFEAGFRTFISRIRKENIFFNADFRYYNELNAKDVIKNADLATQTYFVMALQSTTGMYVSYANGKLPFDARKDEVYSIGFNYKF